MFMVYSVKWDHPWRKLCDSQLHIILEFEKFSNFNKWLW